MATYPLPPGAWLSGATLMPPTDGNTGLMPDPPKRARLSAGWMPDPRHAAHWMPDPPAGTPQSARWMPDPPQGPQPSGPQPPWQGIDPDWVYAGGHEALLGQALRKVHARIMKPTDPRRPRGAKGPQPNSKLQAATAGAPANEPLWRWQPAFRAKAVEAELLSRLVVQDRTLWWMPAPDPKGKAVTPARLFDIQPLAPGFDHSVQIDKVLRAAVEREDRLPEILAQANDIGSFFDAVSGIARTGAPRLNELLEVTWSVTTQVLMAFKNNIADWRPGQRSAQVQPVIATPGHGSLPSGHATMSTVTAALLSALLGSQTALAKERRVQLDRLARRIAFNRVVAGVHFPMDSAAGYALGQALARVLVAAGQGQTLPAGATCKIDENADLREIDELPDAALPADVVAPSGPLLPLRDPAHAAPLFGTLLGAAAQEVVQLRV